MLKKIFLSTLLVSTFLLSGCLQGKEPVDSSTFKDLAKDKNLEIVDIEDEIEAYDMDAALLAYSEDDTYQIEFYDFEDANTAAKEFNSQTTMVDELYSTGNKFSSSIGGTSSFTYKIGDEYYAIIKVDDTLIYAYTDDNEVENIDTFLKELGYK